MGVDAFGDERRPAQVAVGQGLVDDFGIDAIQQAMFAREPVAEVVAYADDAAHAGQLGYRRAEIDAVEEIGLEEINALAAQEPRKDARRGEGLAAGK